MILQRQRMFKSVSKYIIGICLILNTLTANSQDNTYSWNDLVSWNGVTHWTNYLIISPGYFGPNALPIPDLKTGLVENKPYYQFDLVSHISEGDKTANSFFRYIHPFGDKISVEMSFVPLEYYSINSTIRDKRKIALF